MLRINVIRWPNVIEITCYEGSSFQSLNQKELAICVVSYGSVATRGFTQAGSEGVQCRVVAFLSPAWNMNFPKFVHIFSISWIQYILKDFAFLFSDDLYNSDVIEG